MCCVIEMQTPSLIGSKHICMHIYTYVHTYLPTDMLTCIHVRTYIHKHTPTEQLTLWHCFVVGLVFLEGKLLIKYSIFLCPDIETYVLNSRIFVCKVLWTVTQCSFRKFRCLVVKTFIFTLCQTNKALSTPMMTPLQVTPILTPWARRVDELSLNGNTIYDTIPPGRYDSPPLRLWPKSEWWPCFLIHALFIISENLFKML